MQPASPTVGVLWCALDGDVWRGIEEHQGRYGEVRVPLTKSVMYAMGNMWESEVEWVVVGVGVIVDDEGCKVGAVVYIENGDGIV